jgi:hypothetical protein
LRPSKIAGVLSFVLMVAKSGLRNSCHSVTRASASAPSSAAIAEPTISTFALEANSFFASPPAAGS